MFLTGLPGLNQPEKVIRPSEELRLNTSTPTVAPARRNRLGVIAGDNAGYPNGRHPGDDVVDITLRVAMGRLYTLGLFGSPSDAPSGWPGLYRRRLHNREAVRHRVPLPDHADRRFASIRVRGGLDQRRARQTGRMPVTMLPLTTTCAGFAQRRPSLLAGFVWLAIADLLLDRGRLREVVAMLADRTRIDPLLLRLAEAEERLGTPDPVHVAVLAQSFETSRRRGDIVHQREQARFELHVLHQPADALTTARANWQVQHEPADARM